MFGHHQGRVEVLHGFPITTAIGKNKDIADKKHRAHHQPNTIQTACHLKHQLKRSSHETDHPHPQQLEEDPLQGREDQTHHHHTMHPGTIYHPVRQKGEGEQPETED